MLQKSAFGFDPRPNIDTSSGEMSCDMSSERLSLLSRCREQVVENMVGHIREKDGFLDKASCLPSTSRNPVKRRVRFQKPLHDCPRLSYVNIYFGVESHGDDPRLDHLYWSRKDLLMAKKRAQLKARVVRGKFPLEVESLEHMIQNCRGATTSGDGRRCHENDSKAILVDNAASYLNILNSETKDVLVMYNWSSSYVRGLEDYVTPILSSERRYMIHQFLSFQEFLRHTRAVGTNIESALCERSRQLSQNARVFAFKLAIGDALAATHP
jgi:hypothetical protein